MICNIHRCSNRINICWCDWISSKCKYKIICDRCTVEVTVYRLNAVAVTAFLLDGPETLLRHIGLDERDTYTTKHEIDDLVTVVHITREEAPAWQH